jgi:hypothetical protein
VLAVVHHATEGQLTIYPTGAGQTQPLPSPGLRVSTARWLPGGRILLLGVEPGRRRRWYVRGEQGGAPKPLPYEGYKFLSVAPDGRRFVSVDPEGRSVICTVDGAEAVAVVGLSIDDVVVGWSTDEKSVYVRRGRRSLIPVRIDRVELATGRAERFREIAPADVTGIDSIFPVQVAPDGRSYAYGYGRFLSTLFLVDGVK